MIVNIPLICAVIAILACIYASYSDMKNGIIPNKLTFPLIGIGIVLNGIYAFTIGNPLFIVMALIYTAVIFVLGYVFWKFGAWAGGDVKLFTALAALLPFPVTLFNYTILNEQFPVIATYPFPLTLILNSILSIFPFLLIFVFYVAVKTKPHLVGELLSPVKQYKKNIVLSLAITSAVTITFQLTQLLHIQMFQYQILILSFILIYILTLVISKSPNRIKAVIISVVTVFALYEKFEITLMGILFLMISLTVIEIIKKLLTTVSREALQDDYNISELREGMIPAYNLYEKYDKVYTDDKSFLSKFKEAMKTGDVTGLTAPKGKLLISTMAAGLTDKDVELLEDLLNKGKINDSFRVKRGVPFAPSIFIGLLISLFIGDLVFIVEKVLYSIMY
ncbi:A24 family peptidase C-terminal domain-containing protein [Methanobacterium paludis]|nr:A24 family peptidase C-terminal domain-containing protein [Methanobacterium paludis]